MKITIVSSDRTLGHGGAANLGDAFLTDSLAEAIRSRNHEVNVIDFGPVPRSVGTDRVRVDGMLNAIRELKSADALVIGGGTLFQDDRPDRLVGGLPRLMAYISMTATILRKPVVFYGIGIDPVNRHFSKFLLRRALGKKLAWVRDQESSVRALHMFGRTVELGADASLLSRGDKNLPVWNSDSDTLLFALNRSETAQLSQVLIDKSHTYENLVPRFLAMEQQAVGGDAEALDSDSKEYLNYSDEVLDWPEAYSRISQSKVLVASRMHALYMAVLSGTPAIAIGNRPKVVAFAREFGIPIVGRLDEIDRNMVQKARPTRIENIETASIRANTALERLMHYLSSGASV